VALDAGARIVGVNNRNLRTLEVDVRTSEELIQQIPPEVIAVSESGLQSGQDIMQLRRLGYRGFLIGERFMSAPDPGAALRDVLDAATEPARVVAPAFGKAKGSRT
jgi:indole-3-glycerol phosphate synthase